MNELDYKPNSHRFREKQQEEKRVKKVVSGTVKIKKKGEMRKLADVFISEDVANVKSYVLMDVLVPAIKKAIVDIVENGINMVLMATPVAAEITLVITCPIIVSQTVIEETIVEIPVREPALIMTTWYLKVDARLKRFASRWKTSSILMVL